MQLTFDNIIGPGLIILYRNLQQKGAGVSFSFNYDAWLQTGLRKIIFIPIEPMPILGHPVVTRLPVATMRQVVLSSVPVTFHPMPPTTVPPVMFHPIPPVTTPPPATFERTTMTAAFQRSLDNKYITNDYSLKFTITDDSADTRPIINVNDLTGLT